MRGSMTVLRSPLRSVLRSPLYSPLVGKWGGDFSPSDLFQSGDILLWYDPSDLTTMFTNTTGTTQVAADGDSVALMLDKGQWGGKTLAQVLAAAANQVTNPGPFVNTTGWTVSGGTLSVVDGKLRVTSSGAGTVYITQTVAGVVSGRGYQIGSVFSGSATFNLYTSGAFTGFQANIPNGSSAIHRATSSSVPITLFWSAAGAGETRDLTSVSIKEIPGRHRLQATGTSMPKYKTDGTLHWLLYDGSDDSSATAAFVWGSDQVAVCSGAYVVNAAASGVLVETSATSTSNNGTFVVILSGAVSGNLFWRSKGTAASDQSRTGATATAHVLTCSGDISDDINRFRLNANEVSVTTDQGTGDFGNYVMYFGRRGGSSLPFSGREYQTVIRNRLLSAAEIANIETYVAAKSGVTL